MNVFRLCSRFLNSSLYNYNPIQIQVRFWERRKFIRRYGYEPKFHSEGLLPRVKGDKYPLFTIPNEPKPDKWHPKEALFGQNDYIDILGDGHVHPSQLIQGVPYWLRNFKGNEMERLVRKRTAKKHWQWLRPHKWNDLDKRIHFLYKRLNYKWKPPQAQYPWSNK